MAVETARTTTEPKNPASTTATHGCCGGEAAAESPKDISEHADHEHHAHPAPSNAAPSSCCCGATEDSRADDAKSCNTISK